MEQNMCTGTKLRIGTTHKIRKFSFFHGVRLVMECSLTCIDC